MVRVHRLGQDCRAHLRRRPHPPRASRKLEARTHLFQRTQMDPDDLPRARTFPALERSRAQGRLVLAPNDHRPESSEPPRCTAHARPRWNFEHASLGKSPPQTASADRERTKFATGQSYRGPARHYSQIAAGRLMPQKPTVENRWWVETTFKKPKKAKSETEMPQLPVAMALYQVAR